MKKNTIVLVQEIADQFTHIYPQPEKQQQIAWWLIQAITQKNKAALIAQADVDLTPDQENLLKKWIHEHAVNLKPLQYILGSVPFGSLDIKVEPPTLIPRPETEEWVYNLIDQLHQLKKKDIAILDLCTGTGCIGLALAHALPHAKIVATDISDEALALAKKNAAHNHVTNIQCIKSDLYAALDTAHKFDLIVTNPPYISETEWETIDPMVKKWEDKRALVTAHDGLALIKKIIVDAANYLQPNEELAEHSIPQLTIEIGQAQADDVEKIMRDYSFKNVQTHKDLFGNDRIVTGRI